MRLTPVAIPDALLLDLEERVYGASYHEAKRTLNLVPERVFGTDLVRFVERWLHRGRHRGRRARRVTVLLRPREPGSRRVDWTA